MAQQKNKICISCQRVFRGRTDAKTCSATCRKRLQRAKTTVEADVLEAGRKLEESIQTLESKMLPAAVANQAGFVGDGQLETPVAPPPPVVPPPPIAPPVSTPLQSAPVIPALAQVTAPLPEVPVQDLESEPESVLPTAATLDNISSYNDQAVAQKYYPFRLGKWWAPIGVLALVIVALFLLSGPFKHKSVNNQNGANVPVTLDAASSLSPTGVLGLNYDTQLASGKTLAVAGAVTIGTNSSQALVVQNSAGSNVFSVDTQNSKVVIGGNLQASGTLIASGGSTSLDNSGLRINNVLVCTSSGCLSNNSSSANSSVDLANATLQGNTFNGPGQLVQLTGAGGLPAISGSALTSLNGSSISLGTIADARLSNNVALLNANQVFSGNNTFTNQLQAASVNSTTGFSFNGSAGSSFSCAPGELLSDPVIKGGIITGGTCALGDGASVATLQDSYNASTPADVVLSSANGPLLLQDASTPLGTDLFAVESNDGSSKYFEVSSTGLTTNGSINGTSIFQNGNAVCDTSGNCTGVAGIGGSGTTGQIALFSGTSSIGNSNLAQSGSTVTATGNLNVTGQYQVGGSQIASGNLADSTNLAKLNATQTFTGVNTFSNSSNSFSGNGSGLTSVNAATLQGNNSAFFTNANNITSGTLSDSRLSANVALLNGNNKFTGTFLAQNAANSTSAFQIQNVAGTSNLLIADTTNSRIGIGKAPTLGTLDVGGNIFQNGNQVCDTSGNCVGGGGAGAVGGSGTVGTLPVFTGSGFTIGNSLLAQSGSTVTVTGNINATALIEVGGSQISSANLSNDSNLAKLNGSQTFSGANTFSNASNSFTGSGSGLSSLNATNISSGTLNDGRLSTNVALLNASQTFSGNNTFSNTIVAPALQSAGATLGVGSAAATLNLQGNISSTLVAVSGAHSVTVGFNGTLGGNLVYQFDNTAAAGTYSICTTAGNCTGVGGGVTTAGGTTNQLAKFTGSGSIGNSSISDNGTVVTVKPASDSTNIFQIQNAGGTSNLLIADSTNSRIGIGKAPTQGALDVNGSIFQSGNQVCDTSGNCVGGGGAGAVGGSGTAGTIAVFTGSGFTIGNSLLAQAGSTVTVTGNLNLASGDKYEINGSQISSANLSNDSNLAKLNGTGPQTFTGNNKFTGTVLSQNTSDSTAALQVQNALGNNVLTVDTSGTQVVLGKASTLDGKLAFSSVSGSGSIALAPANPGSSNFTITLPAATGTVCLTTGNCTGVSGGAIGGGGTTGTIPVFTGSGFTVGDSNLAQSGSTVTATGNLNVTSQYQVGGSQIASGNLADSANLAKLNATQNFTGNNTFTGTVLDKNASDSTAAFQIQNSAGSSNLLIADTTHSRIAIGQATATYTLDVGGDINTTTGFRVAGTPGSSTTCSGGNILQNAVVNGGIITGGTCVANGGTAPTFAQVYNSGSSSSDETATLSSGNGGLVIQDALSPIGANLFTVQSNGGSTKYFGVTSAGIGITGNVNTSGQYQVGGSQIASGNLADSANLAKLNGTGPQTFTGNNKFTGSVLAEDSSNSATAFQVQNASGNNELTVDSSGNNIVLGKASTLTTNVVFNNASGSGSITLAVANPSTSNFTITLPAETGTLCTTAASAACVTAYSGGLGGSFIQLQGSTPGTAQTGNFNISGTGIAGTLEAGTVDTASAAALGIGTTNATAINLNQNTVVASNKTLTVNGTSLFQNATDSTTAVQIEDASGNNLLNVDTTTNKTVTIGHGGTSNINDNLTTNAPTGTLNDSAFWSAGNYVQVTNGDNTHGELDYNQSITGNLDAKFDLYSSSYSGVVFYAYDASVPHDAIWNSTGSNGYHVFIAPVYSEVWLYYNGTIIASSSPSLPQNTWLSSEVVKTGNNIKVYVNGVKDIDFNDTTRTLSGTHFGLAGDNLGSSGPQRVRNFTLVSGGAVNATLDANGTALFQSVSDSATTFQVQNAAGNEYIQADTSGATLSLGNTGIASTIQVGNTTGAVAQTINIGNNSTASSTNNVTIGSTVSGGTTKLQAGATTQTITNTGDLIKTTTNSTTAFQIQNATSASVLDVDTTNNYVGINNATPNAALDVVGSSAPFFDGFESGALNPFTTTSSGGAAVWATTTNPHSGSFSAHGTLTNQNQTSNLVLTETLSAPGTVSFWYEDSSGGSFPATVQFLVDGVSQFSCNNGTGCHAAFTQYTSSSITAGTHTFTWHLVSNVAEDSASMYLDDVTITNAGTPTAATFNGGSVGIGTYFPGQTLEVDGTSLFKTTTNSASGFQIQNANGNNYIQADTSGANLYLGNTGIASTIQIGNTTGAVTQTINIGNNSTASSTNNVTIGSTVSGGTTKLQAGATSQTITNSGDLLKTTTNSATAFQIQGSAGATATLLTADTTNARIGVDNSYAAMTVPTTLAGSPIAGGALTAGAYKYEVTAIDSAGGETTVSNEATCTTASSNLTCSLTWTAVTGASGYKVYRTAAAGASGTEKYLTTVLTNSYKDTGSVTLSAVATPTTNTAVVSTNSSNSSLQLSVGGNGTPTGQVYVSGTVPSSTLSSTPISAATNTEAVITQGKYSYVLTNSVLQAIDVSNPLTPLILGSINVGSQPDGFYIQGHYAYVVDGGAKLLRVIDISNPSSLSSVGTVTTGVNPYGVYVSGRYAYITNKTSATLQIFDISQPSSPVFVSSIATGTSPVGVMVQGRYAYVTNSGSNSLQIFDISNPSSPSSVGTATTGSTPASLFVQGRYAYVSNASTMQIIDVSNPTSPVVAGSISNGSSPYSQGVFLQGRYLYIAQNASSGIKVVDVSNPATPLNLGTISSSSDVYGVYASGRYLYAASNFSASLQIFDLGGEYAQQLEAGGAEVGTLAVDSNASFAGDASIQGGLQIGQSLQASGNLSTAGNAFIQGSTQFNGGILGGTTISSLVTPSAPTITPTGTTGSTNYSYTVTAVDTAGETTASTAGTTSTGNASLSGTNYNQLTWSAVTGATGYKIYRTVGGATQGLIGTTSSTIFLDTGLAASGSAPMVNSTGNLTVNSSNTVFKSTTNNTTAFQIQNSAGTSLLNADTTNSQVTIQGDVNVGTIAGTGSAGRLFSDNFESGSFGLWDQGAFGSISISTTVAHDGKYAAKVNPSSSFGLADASITPSTTVYARAWVYYVSGTSTTDLFSIVSSATSKGLGVFVDSGGTGDIVVYDTNTSTQLAGSVLTPNTWHLVELRDTIGSSTGVTQLWLDGVLQSGINSSSQNNGTTNLDDVEIGEGSTRTETYYLDDFSADTVSNGAASSLSVDDSLHVGGTSTFANNVLMQNTSTAALQVQDSSGNNVFLVDTSTNSGQVEVRVNGNSPASGQRLCSNLGNGASGLSAIYDCGATQADYAEQYGTSDPSIAAGDLVALDASRPATAYTASNGAQGSKAWIVKASSANAGQLLGVVSTDYNDLIGQDYDNSDNPRPVSLNGRVPLKVDDQNGAIQPGDYLVPSDTPGVAMKATASGWAIGVALSGFSGSGQGTVYVSTGRTYYVQNVNLQDAQSVDGLAVNGDLAVAGKASFQGDIVLAGHIIGNHDTNGTVTVDNGASSADLTFSKAYGQTPDVVVTPETNPGSGYWVSKSTTGFTVHLASPATTSVEFDYIVQQ